MFANRYDEVYGEYKRERIVENRAATKPVDINSRVKSLQKLLAGLAFSQLVVKGAGKPGEVSASAADQATKLLKDYNKYCDDLFPDPLSGDKERVRDELLAELNLDVSDLSGITRIRMAYTCTFIANSIFVFAQRSTVIIFSDSDRSIFRSSFQLERSMTRMPSPAQNLATLAKSFRRLPTTTGLRGCVSWRPTTFRHLARSGMTLCGTCWVSFTQTIV
jgi:hypothetical protein